MVTDSDEAEQVTLSLSARVIIPVLYLEIQVPATKPRDPGHLPVSLRPRRIGFTIRSAARARSVWRDAVVSQRSHHRLDRPAQGGGPDGRPAALGVLLRAAGAAGPADAPGRPPPRRRRGGRGPERPRQ